MDVSGWAHIGACPWLRIRMGGIRTWVRTMKNNYDLILNFEKEDGTPLTPEEIEEILRHGEYAAAVITSYHRMKFWKVIISQAVDSRKVSQFIENHEDDESGG